jgi:hypothetical protein
MFLLFLLLAFPGFAAAQTRDLTAYEGKPRIRVVQLAPGENISVDGNLEEPAWQRAIPAADFVQQDPDVGMPATERTEVRFLMTSRTLYMGVTLYDSEPGNMYANTMQRDGSLAADDRFIWAFDTYLDARSGYYFEMNPKGAMGDSLLLSTSATGGGDSARAWDGIWTGKVQRNEMGWAIEIEIPFRTLNFDPNAPAWGVNFQRTLRRREEESFWTGFARNQGIRRMASYGLLEGISDVSQGIGLDVQPYAAGNYTDAPGRNIKSNFDKDAGIDLIYNVTPSLKSTFTVNTDFAETQVDQRRVNLTRFPLFFPERRQFFLEGTTVFDFSQDTQAIIPFFSRRIGLDVDGHPQRIDYGAKVTGQIAGRDIGLIHVRTADSGNLAGENFTVMRAKQKFFLQSYAGLIYTRRDEHGTTAAQRQTFGADFSLRTSRLAGSKNLEVSGFYVGNTRNGTERGGSAFGFRIDSPNELIDARGSVREIQPGYNPAVGFVERRGFRYYQPGIGIMPRPKNSKLVRNFLFDAVMRLTTDMNNRRLTHQFDLKPFQVNFQSGDQFLFYLTPLYERLERNFQISRGVLLPIGGEYNFLRYGVRLTTTNRRVLAVGATYENGTFYSGHRRDFVLNLGIRPMPGVLINLNNEWNRIELPEGNFSTSVLRFNANTQFSPWISLVNNLQYDSVSRIMGLQSRFRWILSPGNDLHFVYAQNWLESPIAGRQTLDRTAATKLVYTHRF